MAPEIEIAWLAGLLEGDGCFTTNGILPVVAVAMLDRDIIERAAKILKCKIDMYKTPKGNTMYRAKTARRAVVEPLLTSVFPYMGNRRKERILQLLNIYKSPRGGVPSQT